MPSRDDEIEEAYAREYDAEYADRFLDTGGQTYHWDDARSKVARWAQVRADLAAEDWRAHPWWEMVPRD